MIPAALPWGPQTHTVTYGDVVWLQHTYTGRFLTLRKRSQSLVERSCFRMSLVEENDVDDSTCLGFRILPRYKVPPGLCLGKAMSEPQFAP